MIRAILLVAMACPAAAQTITGQDEPFRIGRPDVTAQFQEKVVNAPIAVLRGLDKLTGVARDIEVAVDEPLNFGRVSLVLTQCRYPQNNPTGNAYAYLTVRNARGAEDAPVLFEGWMVAASPALNAMDHPRYDIWVKRCKLASERVGSESAEDQDDDAAGQAGGARSPRPTMRP